VILPSTKPTNGPIPWVWYAPTLPGLPGTEEKWMFERFTAAGIAIAGIDVGESYGSPDGCALYSAFYDELIKELNYAYAKATDKALVAKLAADGTQGSTQAATIAGLKAYIAKETPAAYLAAGKFAKNLIANTAWWETIITAEDTTNRPLFIAAQPANSPGNVGVNSLTGTVMGQNLFVDPHMTTTTLIDDSAFLVVPESVTFYEAPKTQIQVQTLANGRLQVAVYGYYAIATKVGAGIRRFNLT
jgi:hypothetical protein